MMYRRVIGDVHMPLDIADLGYRTRDRPVSIALRDGCQQISGVYFLRCPTHGLSFVSPAVSLVRCPTKAGNTGARGR
jgi:hypothetical protein